MRPKRVLGVQMERNNTGAALQIQDRSPDSRPVVSRNQSQTQLTQPVAPWESTYHRNTFWGALSVKPGSAGYSVEVRKELKKVEKNKRGDIFTSTKYPAESGLTLNAPQNVFRC